VLVLAKDNTWFNFGRISAAFLEFEMSTFFDDDLDYTEETDRGTPI